jgi:hypothetical protein
VKVLLIGHEHIAYQIGIIYEEQMLRPDLVVRDVSVIASHGDHQPEWIARHLKHELKRVSRFWPWWKSVLPAARSESWKPS